MSHQQTPLHNSANQQETYINNTQNKNHTINNQTPINQNRQQYEQQEQQEQQFQQQQNYLPQARCVYHQDLWVTNFCQESKCLLPLCPECIPTHIQLHKQSGTFPTIQRIETVQVDALKTIQQIQKQMISNHDQISDLSKLFESETVKNMRNQLQQSKQQVLNMVNQYFSTLEQDFENLIQQQSLKNTTELETAARFIAQKNSDLSALEQKLQTEKFLKYIVRLYSSNYVQESLTFNQDCSNYIKSYKDNELLSIKPDETKLYTIQMELSKFISLQNSEKLRQQNQNSQPFQLIQQQQQNYSNMLSPSQQKVNPNTLQQTQHQPTQFNQPFYEQSSNQGQNLLLQQQSIQYGQKQQQPIAQNTQNTVFQTPQSQNKLDYYSNYQHPQQQQQNQIKPQQNQQASQYQIQQNNQQMPPPFSTFEPYNSNQLQSKKDPIQESQIVDPFQGNDKAMLYSKQTNFNERPQSSFMNNNKSTNSRPEYRSDLFNIKLGTTSQNQNNESYKQKYQSSIDNNQQFQKNPYDNGISIGQQTPLKY